MSKSEPKAKMVLYLKDIESRSSITEIEEPPAIPTVGDKVRFAGRYWVAVEREITYHGSSGPDRQCLVTVLLRDPLRKD
jgi:hypothetical protein